jgi:hypothetical protein
MSGRPGAVCLAIASGGAETKHTTAALVYVCSVNVESASRPVELPPLSRTRSGLGKDVPAVSDSPARNGGERYCTRRRDNAHKIEERQVLYPWHP